ncbi:MAG: TatD family hydrolase, partial [Myroides sp.]
RGKRNESSYVALVAQKLAAIYNLSVEEIAQQTTKNALNIFKL